MITIAEAIADQIEHSPYLQDALSRQLINLSALAREMRPGIEQSLLKPVSETAVFMALKRYSQKLQDHPKNTKSVSEFFGDITVKSDLFELVMANSDTLLPKIQEITKKLLDSDSAYLTHTSGNRHTALIANNASSSMVKEALAGEKVTDSFSNLIAITIHFVGKYMETAGLYEYPIKQLAWEGVSIVEVVSAYSELTLIIESRDVDRAFSILHRALGRNE